jgi:hypothetical protein
MTKLQRVTNDLHSVKKPQRYVKVDLDSVEFATPPRP